MAPGSPPPAYASTSDRAGGPSTPLFPLATSPCRVVASGLAECLQGSEDQWKRPVWIFSHILVFPLNHVLHLPVILLLVLLFLLLLTFLITVDKNLGLWLHHPPFCPSFQENLNPRPTGRGEIILARENLALIGHPVARAQHFPLPLSAGLVHPVHDDELRDALNILEVVSAPLECPTPRDHIVIQLSKHQWLSQSNLQATN